MALTVGAEVHSGDPAVAAVGVGDPMDAVAAGRQPGNAYAVARIGITNDPDPVGGNDVAQEIAVVFADAVDAVEDALGVDARSIVRAVSLDGRDGEGPVGGGGDAGTVGGGGVDAEPARAGGVVAVQRLLTALAGPGDDALDPRAVDGRPADALTTTRTGVLALDAVLAALSGDSLQAITG